MEESPDGRILSQLLAAHSVLHILPSSKMGEFVTSALKTVPGVDSAGMCTRDFSAPVGSLDFKACLDCGATWKNANEITLNDCPLTSNEDIRALPIETADRFYGFLLLGVERTEDFILYEPFLKNFANSVAIILENRWQKGRLMQRTEESEARYQDLYDNAPDLFVSVEAATAKILRCNQTLATALGYTKDEIIGQPVFFVYHPDCLEAARAAFRSFVETGEVRDAELQLRRKDGSAIEVSLNVSAVRDGQGKVLYSRSVWRDITERN